MRWSAVCAMLVMLGVLLLGANRQPETCNVQVKLVDAETGAALSGLLRVSTQMGERLELPGLLSRGQGMPDNSPLHRWSVLPAAKTIELPREKLTFSAIAGLEFAGGAKTVDLAEKGAAVVEIPLRAFARPREQGLRSANTHLHLMKLTRADCDRYLREIPRADGLDLVFVSYLERAIADREYISNRYSREDLEALSKPAGVLFGNGEEHRHNFTGFNEGYGHVMLLDITKLVQPVSIGPGIMQMGTDGLPLARGLESARTDGATNLWCHNAWGVERIPSWVTGRVDAQNIFDGGVHGSYKDSFYRYLNAGFKVPFSTGTDWFQYDYSRVYAEVDGPLTVESWLAALKAGRTYITNGPLFELDVSGKSIGSTLNVKSGGNVKVRCRAVGRSHFKRLELVRNGEVIEMVECHPDQGHFVAEMSLNLPVEKACWLAARIPPPPVKDDPDLQEDVYRNDLGQELFGHTSAVYVNVDGKGMFDRQEVARLVEDMERNVVEITRTGQFADDLEKARVLDVHQEAISILSERLK